VIKQISSPIGFHRLQDFNEVHHLFRIFLIHDIQPGYYAVFTVPMDSIGPAFGYIYGTWLPASGYKHRGTPDVEYYTMSSHSDNSMQIMIPVEPTA
jgi:predicted transcriptional regulator YdeE